jgi:ribosomal protein S18 acetylase RimI-like enzyme
MRMLLRDATESDAESIAHVQIAAWRAAYRGIVADHVLANLTLEKQSKLWREIITGHGNGAVLAFDDNELVGFLSFRHVRDKDLDPSNTAEVTACYVDPNHWRCGIGSALWEETENRLRAGSCFKEIALWVFRENVAARRFYERIGFQFDGTEQPVPWLEGSPPEVRYRRALHP